MDSHSVVGIAGPRDPPVAAAAPSGRRWKPRRQPVNRWASSRQVITVAILLIEAIAPTCSRDHDVADHLVDEAVGGIHISGPIVANKNGTYDNPMPVHWYDNEYADCYPDPAHLILFE